MIIGVPKEIKVKENRVSLTPGGAHSLIAAGHRILVERGAGEGSGSVAEAGAAMAGGGEGAGAPRSSRRSDSGST